MSTATSLARFFLAADIGVIKLNHTPKVIALVPTLNGFSNLMTPGPGGLIGQVQIVLELTSRGICGSGGNKKNSPKPVSQRLPSSVKDGVGSDRSLMTTTRTLIQFAGFNEVDPIMTTTRVLKTVRLFSFNEIPQTIPLSTKPQFKLSGRHYVIQD